MKTLHSLEELSCLKREKRPRITRVAATPQRASVADVESPKEKLEKMFNITLKSATTSKNWVAFMWGRAISCTADVAKECTKVGIKVQHIDDIK